MLKDVKIQYGSVDGLSEEDRIAIRFMVDVIEGAMKKYNISFNTLDSIFKKTGYWEVFENTRVTLAAAHCGIEEIFEIIEKEL